jgi:hypothetical protein
MNMNANINYGRLWRKKREKEKSLPVVDGDILPPIPALLNRLRVSSTMVNRTKLDLKGTA